MDPRIDQVNDHTNGYHPDPREHPTCPVCVWVIESAPILSAKPVEVLSADRYTVQTS